MGSATYALEGSATWGPDQVGKNLVELVYSKIHLSNRLIGHIEVVRGSVSPGSSIDVYQWIESDKSREL